MAKYWIYENWTLKKAILHRSLCGSCNDGNGIHPNKSDLNSEWHPFETLTEGQAFLQSVRHKYNNVRSCSRCALDDGFAPVSRENPDPHTLTISHADASPFAPNGLRAFFEYRDLGINSATSGDIGAHVIRAVPGEASAAAWHSHDLTFQMVYVTKGWVEFEYAGHGKVMMRAGSSVLQPPNIVHRLIRNSDDMELLEITAPAEFETAPEDTPE